MLSSRQPCSLLLGCDSRTTVAPHCLAFPLHPQLQLSGIATQHSLGVPSPPLTPEHLRCITTSTLSDYVESRCCSFFPNQTAKGVAQRKIMLSPFSTTTPISTQHTSFTLPSQNTEETKFTFRVSPRPEMALAFPQRPSPPRLKKRCRPVADIDGEHSCIHKKKRRLRLFLITSRLSPQFSHPATNIVDRGSSKIAVWAKQKALGRNLLRKAAILNRIGRQATREREAKGGLGRVLVEQEREQEELRLAKLTFTCGSTDTYARPGLHRRTPSPPPAASRFKDCYERSSSSPSRSPSGSPSPPLRALDADSPAEYRSPNDAYSYSPPSRSKSPRRSYLPLPPSPLGLSNYDAFDTEDDLPDLYAHLNEEFDTGHDDDDTREDAPFPFAAATATRPPIVRMCSNETSKTPPQAIYSDFSMLDPDEPVFGDYDQVEEGANAIWPDAFGTDAQGILPALPLSSSPDFPAIFATTHPTTAPVSPNFKPSTLESSHTMTIPISPDFVPSSTGSVLSPTPSSPNFGPISHTLKDLDGVGEDAKPRAYQPKITRRGSESEMEQERERQRKYMFMQFGS